MRLLLNILIIWALAWIALFFARNLLRLFQRQIAGRVAQSSDYRRIDTLSGVIRHAATVVVIGVAILLSLSEFGISITPMLATAGVAGIAIGFGAQSLVRDFFSGFFLLMENQVSEGEMIEAAGKSGCVEEVTLRHIRLRDEDGSVHFIPNGIITTVTNKSRNYAVAIIDVSVPRQQDPEQAMHVLGAVGAALRQDPGIGPFILDVIDVAGIEKLEDAAVTLRCKLKVLPLKQTLVRREFLRRARLALDKSPAAPTPEPESATAGRVADPARPFKSGGLGVPAPTEAAWSESTVSPTSAGSVDSSDSCTHAVPIRKLPSERDVHPD